VRIIRSKSAVKQVIAATVLVDLLEMRMLPGIHNSGLWLWIPGSPLVAPGLPGLEI